MGLNFWGGFASGMSKSIEQERDRKLTLDKVKQDAVDASNKALAKQKKDIYDTKVDAEKRLNTLVSERRKVMSGAYEGTEESRVDTINEINGKIFDVYTSANEYAAGLGEKPIIDISGLDVAQMDTVKIGDKKYVLPQDLAASIIESDGKMKLVGNEVHQAVYEPNSTGRPIEKKDGNGNVVYEPSGVALREYNDVFKASNKGKTKEFAISELPKKEQVLFKRMGYRDGDKIPSSLRTKIVGQELEQRTIALPNGSEVVADAEGVPVRGKDGKMIFTKRSKEAKDMLEKKATIEGVLTDLDRSYEVVKGDPHTVGSLGNNTADWIGNILNDITKIPTPTRLEREKLLQFTEPLAARMRDAVESGVMTDRDLERYLKMLPTPDDSPESFVSKYKTLRDDIKKKYEHFETAMQDEKPSEKVKAEKREYTRDEAYSEVKNRYPNWSSAKINRFLKTKGY